MSEARPVHKRILLKLSGEALMGDDAFGINRALTREDFARLAGKASRPGHRGRKLPTGR